MTLIKIIEKGNHNTLAIVKKQDQLLIAQIDNADGAVLEVWELSQEDIKKYLQ